MATGKSSSFALTRNSEKLIKVALGKEQADLAIVNARLVNVFTSEILENSTVSIKDKWIAAVGNDLKHSIGTKTQVIDAGGKTVIPGLIDGHTHLAWQYTAYEFLKYAMKGGTTTIITETMEPFPVSGYEGVVDFLDSLKDQPIKIFSTAPFMASISDAARGIAIETLNKFLSRDDMVGLGESYWQSVLQHPNGSLPILHETLLSGKSLEGHSAGAGINKLNAYIAAGISSCHEPIKADEALERLRLGLYVMIREGSIRRDLEEISKIKDFGIDFRRLVVVSDGMEPKDLLEKGYMEFIVQKAINCGFDPITAIQMATLNVAEHFSLDGIIGGIAPGRYADMLIIPDERTIEAQYVISNGRVIAQNGNLLTQPRSHTFTKQSMTSVHSTRKLSPSDFALILPLATEKVEARIINMVTDLVTSEIKMTVPVVDGEISQDIRSDIIKIAAVDRTHHPGKIFTGLIKGFGLKAGAFACSASWDTTDIIVIGANDADMALAVNRIFHLQGGAVVSVNEKIEVELPLPVFGILSELPIEQIADLNEHIKHMLSELGVSFPDPLLSLIALTGAAIPFFRICEEGLVNLKNGNTVGLISN
ncbi:MAG: adenine deaminase C-terminal domain-containing protein [Thermodesulfobacteriota bacterium]|nr:adenine deaminase C-terminal domain-containing protein [Thermodesulfobacteriota bacterium]